MQFAGLMSFAQHNEWLTFLVDAMHREAPPGYNRPSLGQVLQCDRAAWTRLGSTLNSVHQKADGSYPLGEALLKLRSDPNVCLYLSPVAKPAAPSASAETGQWRSQPYGQQRSEKGADKGKSKGKGKSKSTAPSMPQELRGKWYKTSAGEPLCLETTRQVGVRTPRT